MWMKQCGRLHKQPNPIKNKLEHFGLFLLEQAQLCVSFCANILLNSLNLSALFIHLPIHFFIHTSICPSSPFILR